MNFLIVEDNVIIQMFLEMILDKNGHTVVGKASNIKDAVHFLQSQELDFVFLDVGLEDGDSGIDLGQIVKTEYSLLFAFITGNSEVLTAEQIEYLKPEAILSKPVDEVALQELLDSLVNKKK